MSTSVNRFYSMHLNTLRLWMDSAKSLRKLLAPQPHLRVPMRILTWPSIALFPCSSAKHPASKPL